MPQIRSRTRARHDENDVAHHPGGYRCRMGRAGGGTRVGDVLDDLADSPQHRRSGKQQEQRAGETSGPRLHSSQIAGR